MVDSLETEAGSRLPGNGVLCMIDFPGAIGESHQTIVSLKYGADCPGRRFDGLNDMFCLIEYPSGWQSFVH